MVYFNLNTKPCPFCAEIIQARAMKCRFCGEFLNTAKARAMRAEAEAQADSPPDEEGQVNDGVMFTGRPSLFGMIPAFTKGLTMLAILWLFIKFPVENMVNNRFGLSYSEEMALTIGRYREIIGWALGGVVIFGAGLDPADMVKEGRVEELANMFREPKVFIEFVLDEILSLYDLRDPKAKESCMGEGIAYLKTLSPLLQEEYKTYLASRLGGLGVSPSLLKVTNQTNTNNQNAPLLQKNTHKDMWELSLIKTVIEHPRFIDQILDVLDPSLLQFHSQEFASALQGQNDNPYLMAIMIDESIQPLKNEDELRAELITFLSRHYERELKKINLQQSISFEEKAFYIRKFRGKIATLKRGELVAFGD